MSEPLSGFDPATYRALNPDVARDRIAMTVEHYLFAEAGAKLPAGRKATCADFFPRAGFT